MELVFELQHSSSWATTLYHIAGLKKFRTFLTCSSTPKSRMQRPETEVSVPYCRVTDTSVPSPSHPSSSPASSEPSRDWGYKKIHSPALQPELNGFLGKALEAEAEWGRTQGGVHADGWSFSHLICTKNCRSQLILYQRQTLWQWR